MEALTDESLRPDPRQSAIRSVPQGRSNRSPSSPVVVAAPNTEAEIGVTMYRKPSFPIVLYCRSRPSGTVRLHRRTYTTVTAGRSTQPSDASASPAGKPTSRSSGQSITQAIFDIPADAEHWVVNSARRLPRNRHRWIARASCWSAQPLKIVPMSAPSSTDRRRRQAAQGCSHRQRIALCDGRHHGQKLQRQRRHHQQEPASPCATWSPTRPATTASIPSSPKTFWSKTAPPPA